MAYTDFHTKQHEFRYGGVPGLRDPDGNIIYETEYGVLLKTIVALNDVATLKRYIEINPRGPLCPAEVYHWDPFYIAAVQGSTDALRILIDHYDANPVLFDIEGKNPTPTKGPNERGISLLNTACYGANPETACFLMDRQPPLGSVHDTNACGDTPLLDAAASLAQHNFSEWIDGRCTYQWYRDRLARGEKLINILLDRGACARDSRTTGFFRGDYNEQIAQPRETVLSLAISSGSYGLIKRLIDQGADVQRKDWYHRNHDTSLDAQNVTLLHIGSSHWNVDGIKALIDHGGSNLVSSYDSEERLPVHWAAAGQRSGIDDIIPENEFETRIIDTFKLLLTLNAGVINAQDKKGATPLHHAVAAHAGCGTGHSYPVIKYL